MKLSDHVFSKVFDTLSAHIVIINVQGQILKTNLAWKEFSIANGMPPDYDYYQLNYFRICDDAEGEGADDALSVGRGIKNVINGHTKEFLYDYPCHSPDRKRWFYMRAIYMDDQGEGRVIISHDDITELKLVQEELAEHQKALEHKNESLNEANIALKVLLQQRESDKQEMEQNILSNLKTFVLPHLNKLKTGRLGKNEKTLVELIETHLNEITSPFIKHFSNAEIILTPQELQVATLVKEGRTTTEIADILFVSEATVNFHRKNLRKKMGISNKRSNLRTFLLSMK